MPVLPSGGSRWIDSAANAVRAVPMVVQEVSPGVFEYVSGGQADVEYVDVNGTGEYERVPVGTAPKARRALTFRVGTNLITY